MSQIYLAQSNRLENLVDPLHEVITRSPLGPLATEVVMVQSVGMGRWISLQMADRCGVWANFSYRFPNAFIADLFEQLCPDYEQKIIVDKQILAWKIFSLLYQLGDDPHFALVRNYLEETNQVKYFQLAEKIADTFDQYMMYRPKMIEAWSRGEYIIPSGNQWVDIPVEHYWQPLLFSHICRNESYVHRTEIQRYLLEHIDEKALHKRMLPSRVIVFGISSLPVFHVEILQKLSEIVPVYYFLLSPTNHYWEDIVSDREKARANRQALQKEIDPVDLHYERGNPLLGSLGKLGRDFFSIISEHSFDHYSSAVDDALYEEPQGASLLEQVQADIYNLKDREEERLRLEGRQLDNYMTLAADDHSIMLHSCHSPMREVEVLYDQLLRLLDSDSGLHPRDVIVMTPDIDAYAPFIEAVFGAPENEASRIPFSIADRNMRMQSSVAGALLDICMLAEHRFAATKVIDILSFPEIRQKFTIAEDDLERVTHWITQVGISWGLNEHDRQEYTGISYKQNSWQYGIERFLLGYATRGKDEKLFEHILPFDNIEGSDSELLGKVLDYTRVLFDFFTVIREKHTPEEWARIMAHFLEQMFQVSYERKWEFDRIRDIIMSVQHAAGSAECNELVGFDVVRYYLASTLGENPVTFGFLSGKVTFCALLPMRSIPFKVVCMIGMNNTVYPRVTRKLGFDLMYLYPRKGDRSQRIDDRYLFLESILSARELLYISYIGRHSSDNSALPPSVVVNELMDYILENTTLSGASDERKERMSAVKERLLVEHALQPFNEVYFTGKNENYFSYSKEYYTAALEKAKGGRSSHPFLSKRLHQVLPEEFFSLTIDECIQFFLNPAKYYLQNRLGIFLPGNGLTIDDKEPMDRIAFSDRMKMQERLLEAYLQGEDVSHLFQVYNAAALLPPEKLGSFLYHDFSLQLKNFSTRLAPYLQEETRAEEEISLPLQINTPEGERSIHLSGSLPPLRQSGLIHYRYEEWQRDRVKLWIQHLVLNTLRPKGVTCHSRLISAKADLHFAEVAEAHALLTKLVAYYYEGLCFPLRFFPKISETYAEAICLKKKEPAQALYLAGERWNSDYSRDESQDDYVALCYRGTSDLLDGSFEKISLDFYGPFYAHMNMEESYE